MEIGKNPSPTSDQDVSRLSPLPAWIRGPIRTLLRAWSHFPKAHGYLYYLVENLGSRLAVGPLEGRLSNGARMRCDLCEHMQRQIYFLGAYQPIETFLFPLLVKPGMVVVDAGAHIGQYTLLASPLVGASGAVHAFEPVPRNFEQLAYHIRENGFATTVRMNKVALWHRAETLHLYLKTEHATNPGAYSAGPSLELVDSVTTRAVRLDDYVKENDIRRVDLIKMDIEGAELFALQGAQELITRWRPTMLVELNRPACRGLGYEPEQIWEFLKPCGYEMWYLGASPQACHTLSSPPPEDIANVVFHTEPLSDNITMGWSLKSAMTTNARRGGSW